MQLHFPFERLEKESHRGNKSFTFVCCFKTQMMSEIKGKLTLPIRCDTLSYNQTRRAKLRPSVLAVVSTLAREHMISTAPDLNDYGVHRGSGLCARKGGRPTNWGYTFIMLHEMNNSYFSYAKFHFRVNGPQDNGAAASFWPFTTK